MAPIPNDKGPDSTLALMSEGYTFISARCRRYQSDLFQTRLMLRKVVCMTGEDAAHAFYTPGRFTRNGAMPPTVLKLLQDEESVQQLDGEDHRQRKQMFMSLMGTESITRLADLVDLQWRGYIGKWSHMGRIVLHDEVQEIMCRAVCAWTGLPLTDEEAEQRTREFAAMIDGAGSIGLRNWRGMLFRSRTERWAQNIIDRLRAHEFSVPGESALHAIATHRGRDGALLDTRTAAVELLNILRPTVAVAWFVTFAALALHEHPESRQKLQAGDDQYLEWFVQEVRRFYPFFPFVGGRVRNEFDWNGHHFAMGMWVLLDLYGINHDPRVWDKPNKFNPERFRNWDGSAYNFITQGGGDFHAGHRCPGEWITIELLKRSVSLLTTAMRYDVPEQDLRVTLSRMPTLPKSRLVISNVRQSR